MIIVDFRCFVDAREVSLSERRRGGGPYPTSGAVAAARAGVGGGGCSFLQTPQPHEHFSRVCARGRQPSLPASCRRKRHFLLPWGEFKVWKDRSEECLEDQECGVAARVAEAAPAFYSRYVAHERRICASRHRLPTQKGTSSLRVKRGPRSPQCMP